jgi:hypothetical protein
MRQLFPPVANTIARFSIIGGIVAVAALVYTLGLLDRSPYKTQVNVPVEQPVPFSHEHHVGQLGIDCRYCHTSVENSSFANVPSTDICMTCHSQLYTDSPMLAPVRESLQTGQPLEWNRVNTLPDFVYFDHSAHVEHGVACEECHGRVDQMPLTWKAQTLNMGFCLDCHRDPGPRLRPENEVFSMTWQPPADQTTQGQKLLQDYHIDVNLLTQCSTCHR